MLACFLNSHDHNMKQPRFDFVAIRSDGTAARFHPGSNRPGVVVVGQLSDWRIPVDAPAHLVAPVMERVRAHAETRGAEFQHFSGTHQTDMIGREAAKTWVTEQLALWQD